MYTKSLKITNNPCKRPGSVMQKSVRNINKITLNDKLQISNNIIQDTKLSATLAQGSTGSARVLLSFWNEYILKESKKWLLPEKTTYAALDLNSWNRSLKKMGHSS